MKKLFQALVKTLQDGEDAMLVSVVTHSGSTPRGAGARMLVGDRFQMGTIGGGAVEHKAHQLAVEALAQKRSFVEQFTLSPNEVADLGMICGGSVGVLFQYFPGGVQDILGLVQRVCTALNQDTNSWLITRIASDFSWNMWVYSENMPLQPNSFPEEYAPQLLKSSSVYTQLEEAWYYSQPLVRAGRVYIFGGGHVAQELVPALSQVEFGCVVIEDRPEFASKALFPKAQDVLLVDFTKLDSMVTIRPCDYVVIMTRGHQHDYEILSQMLTTQAAYIGMIGSRNKIAKTMERLFTTGFTQQDTQRVHAPIGLAIQAETPAEIAVSITAQLIQVRALGRKGS